MAVEIKERITRFVEVPSFWAKDHQETDPISLSAGTFDTAVVIQTYSANHAREVEISDLRAALDRIEEEHRR
jgi:hypothetical protein